MSMKSAKQAKAMEQSVFNVLSNINEPFWYGVWYVLAASIPQEKESARQEYIDGMDEAVRFLQGYDHDLTNRLDIVEQKLSEQARQEQQALIRDIFKA